MAKIPEFQQAQLRDINGGVPQLNESGAMIANGLLNSTESMANNLQYNGNRNILSQLIGAVAGNVQQNQFHQKVAQAHADALAKVQQDKFDESTVSARSVDLGFMLNNLKSGVMDAHKDDPQNAATDYNKIFPEAVANHLKSIPGLTSGASAGLQMIANRTAVQAGGELADYAHSQTNNIIAAQNADAQQSVLDNITHFDKEGDPNLRTYTAGMQAINRLAPSMYYELGEAVGKHKLDALSKNASELYMKHLIQMNPNQAKQMLDAGFFKNPGAFLDVNGNAGKGAATDIPVPVLDTDALNKALVSKTESDDSQQNLVDRHAASKQVFVIDRLLTHATVNSSSPDTANNIRAQLVEVATGAMQQPETPGNKTVLEKARGAIATIDSVRRSQDLIAATGERKAEHAIAHDRSEESFQRGEAHRSAIADATSDAGIAARVKAQTEYQNATRSARLNADPHVELSRINSAVEAIDGAGKFLNIPGDMSTEAVKMKAGLEARLGRVNNAIDNKSFPQAPGANDWFHTKSPAELFNDKLTAPAPPEVISAWHGNQDMAIQHHATIVYRRALTKTVDNWKAHNGGKDPSLATLDTIESKVRLNTIMISPYSKTKIGKADGQ